jgi:ACS family glucarate transporter-like MFS transporter
VRLPTGGHSSGLASQLSRCVLAGLWNLNSPSKKDQESNDTLNPSAGVLSQSSARRKEVSLKTASSTTQEPTSPCEISESNPTRVRWRIMAIVMAIMAVTALNRLNLSIAGKAIEEDFSFSTLTMGVVFSAFLWGYGLFQIPWGYVCDRIGPRRTLTVAIFIFAVGTGAMALVPTMAPMAGISVLAGFRMVRFVTGVGEAAISSNVTRVIASWTSLRERGFASGLQVCGLGLGGTLTPVFIAWTMVYWGWRVSFEVCAVLAFVVVTLWHFYATDWPEEHSDVNDPELQIVHPGSRHSDVGARSTHRGVTSVPWLRMLTSLSVWGLILGYGFQGYTFYVYYNWFYFYAVKMRGLGIMQAAAWTSAPFLAMALLSPVGGWFSDRVAQVSDRRRGRLAAVWLGMGVSALLLYSGNHLSVTVIALPMIALAAGFNMFAAANFWASCIDLSPSCSASLSALMNTLGSIGGVISSTVTASIVVHQGWGPALDVAVWITLGAGLLFTLVNANQSIEVEA